MDDWMSISGRLGKTGQRGEARDEHDMTQGGFVQSCVSKRNVSVPL